MDIIKTRWYAFLLAFNVFNPDRFVKKCFPSDGDDLNCKISRRDAPRPSAQSVLFPSMGIFLFLMYIMCRWIVKKAVCVCVCSVRCASVRQSNGERTSRWYAGQRETGVCLPSPSKVKPVGFDLRAGRRCLSRGEGSFLGPGNERGDYKEAEKTMPLSN